MNLDIKKFLNSLDEAEDGKDFQFTNGKKTFSLKEVKMMRIVEQIDSFLAKFANLNFRMI